MITGDEVIGVLHVRSKEIGAYSDRDLGLIEQVGRQIAPAVDNAHFTSNSRKGRSDFESCPANSWTCRRQSGAI